jgi:hypothetical protein
MWKLLKSLLSGGHVDTDVTNDSFYVYRARFSEGFRNVGSLRPHDVVFASGLAV